MKTLFTTSLLCTWLLCTTEVALADSTYTAGTDSSHFRPVNNVFYLDYSTFLLIGSISLNYERTWNNVGVRVGFGEGYAFETGSGSGFMVMGNVFPFEEHKFEMGFGVSVMWVSRFGPEPRRTQLYPAGSICYRLQPPDGGFFLRLGLSYVYYYGTPFTLSIGIAF